MCWTAAAGAHRGDMEHTEVGMEPAGPLLALLELRGADL